MNLKFRRHMLHLMCIMDVLCYTAAGFKFGVWAPREWHRRHKTCTTALKNEAAMKNNNKKNSPRVQSEIIPLKNNFVLTKYALEVTSVSKSFVGTVLYSM